MSAETEIVAALEADAGVHAKVADRIGPWPLDSKETLPALTYYLVASPPTQSMSGSIWERRPHFTIVVWARNPADRRETADAVVACLLGMDGWVEIVDEGRDVPEPVSGLYRREIDVRLLR